MMSNTDEERIYPREDFKEVYKGIIHANLTRERRTLNKSACRSDEAQRRRAESIPDRDNIRAAYSHDTDRIIHCRAYARYIDKTQVFFLMENDHVTHRVLHVQFVSKIARSICRALGLNEDLAEAIALAHDLGHTPFGHAGEAFLSEILQERGGGTFVHNAQSVRVLDLLENVGQGLNLTLQVLDGVLGHNGELLSQELKPHSKPTWEALDENCQKCLLTPKADKEVYPSTLEGCVVRLADVVSYVGRDIEDAIEVGLIKREQVPSEGSKVLGDTNRDIINNLAMDVIQNSYGQDSIRMSEPVFHALKNLMQFNYKTIYLAEPIQEEKRRLEEVFRRLFEAYLKDLVADDMKFPVVKYVSHMDDGYRANTTPARMVTDFMAGMTDDYLISQYHSRFVPRSMGYRLDAVRGVKKNPEQDLEGYTDDTK